MMSKSTSSPFLVSVLFLLLILLINVSVQPATAVPSLCGNSCATRCSKAGVVDRCLKYCGICCEKCRCVPSGTYGNKHECPCYRDWRNSKGRSKCP